MSQEPVLNTSDEWGQFAEAFKKLIDVGPSIAPAEELVKATNAAYPYASASTILDIGCGPGQVVTQLFKSHGPELPGSSRIIASDFSSGMLEQVIDRKNKEVARGETVWNRVETLQCDASDLSTVEDNSVSHALAGFVLFMVPKGDVAFREIRRVLTDQNGGGVLAFSSWEGSEWMDLTKYLSKVLPDKQLPKFPKEWGTVEGVRERLEEAGFRDIDAYASPTFWPFDNYDEIVQYVITQIPIMRKLTADMTKEELEEVQKLMVEDLKTRHPSVPSRMTGTAIIGVGRK